MRLGLLLITLSSFMVSGQVYKVVKEDGSVLYTDDPVAGSEPVEFSEATQNVSATLKPARPLAQQQQKQQKQQQKEAQPDFQVSITSPAPEATIRDNSGNLTIRAQMSPQDIPARFQLVFDGEPLQTNISGVFALSGVNRGAHDFQVNLLDNKGKTLASTPSQTLYLHQASVLINNN